MGELLTIGREPEFRRLDSWIDSFLEFTSKKQSSERFRRWAAISTIAATIERKVWVKTASGNLYPHLFTILIGPAGAGKGVALNAGVNLFKEICTDQGPYISPTSMSSASFSDALFNSHRKIIRPTESPDLVEFNSLFITSRELGALMPMYDVSFMNTITDIYDGEEYRQTRRTRSIDFTIKYPQINILAATTPAFLNKFLPAGAFDEGFISRTILVYSGSVRVASLFDDTDGDERLLGDLINDLKVIGGKFGKMGFREDAARAINEWYISGGEPAPDHPKLFSYVERRPAHLMKLCVIAALARANNKFEIEMEDLELAKAWLEEAEDNMVDIFKAMAGGQSDAQVIEEARYFVWQINLKERRNVSEERLWHFLYEKMPSHNIERVIQTMVKSGRLIAHHGPTSVAYSATGGEKR